jgi:hypothetical protein
MDFKKLKKKSLGRLLPNVCDSKKKTIPQGMDLKIYRKSLALPMDFYSL